MKHYTQEQTGFRQNLDNVVDVRGENRFESFDFGGVAGMVRQAVDRDVAEIIRGINSKMAERK